MTEKTTTTHEHAPAPEPVPDAQLAAASETALGALRAIVPADQIGEGHRVRAEGELLVTHLFPSTARGYRGWEWFVTLTRVPGSEVATVCESGMLPGADALLAPEWVPWSQRMLDGEGDEHDDEAGSGQTASDGTESGGAGEDEGPEAADDAGSDEAASYEAASDEGAEDESPEVGAEDVDDEDSAAEDPEADRSEAEAPEVGAAAAQGRDASQ